MIIVDITNSSSGESMIYMRFNDDFGNNCHRNFICIQASGSTTTTTITADKTEPNDKIQIGYVNWFTDMKKKITF